MNYAVCLAGNPNCGKTTLFNALTGANQRVGNWPGVTVEKKEATLKRGDDVIELIDLPGVYSLTPYSIEEGIAREAIDGGGADVVLNIVDATGLERNLYLTLQLLERGVKVVIALNLMDELRKRRISPDIAALAAALGAPVVPISARKGEGLDALMAQVAAVARGGVPAGKQPRYRDARAPGLDAFTAQAKARYDFIESALARARFPRGAYKRTASDAIDKFVLNPYLAFPIFALFLAAMFLFTFGAPGAALRTLMERVIALAGTGAARLFHAWGSPAWARSVAIEGVIAGVGGVLAFLPQILLLFLCLSVLEDSGYMARAAFMTDRLLQKLGLSGRSFIPMLMGFGCTTTAVLAARGVENERDKRMTIMLTPFMSCGAKLPIYALFVAALFPTTGAWAVLGLYALGIFAMALCGALIKRLYFREGASPFVMELPEYRMPTLRSVARRLSDRARDFMQRAGTVIFAMSVLIWFLRAFTPAMRMTGEVSESMLGALGAAISPFFRPLGFGDAAKCVSLLAGMVAKEAVVSTMQVIYAAPDAGALAASLGAHFTKASAVSFLVFTLLYTPCISALAAMRRELGAPRWLARAAVLQLLFAYGFALFTYRLSLMLF
ncbi:MAG: ferrous iron transport protein B [Christensenellales bacterium]|jgi:ferrous iron transport protein B